MKELNYERLADVIHDAVCEVAKDDGYLWCLDYAILRCDYLSKWTQTPHRVVGGMLIAKDPIQGKHHMAEHFWIERGDIVIDFASRHNPLMLRAQFQSFPVYVGSCDAEHVAYEKRDEPTEHAEKEWVKWLLEDRNYTIMKRMEAAMKK